MNPGAIIITVSGVTGGEGGGRDFPGGNFWRLIGKNEAREKSNKMGNVEEQWKK